MAFGHRHDDHVRRGHPVLLTLILLCSLVEAIVTTWLVHKQNRNNGTGFISRSARRRTEFLVFVAWWTVLLSFVYLITYLISKATSFFSSIGSHGTFLFITWVLWLAGAASITAAFGGASTCGFAPFCREQDVMIAFAWIVFALITLDLFLTLLRAGTAFGRGGTFGGPMAPAAQTTSGPLQGGKIGRTQAV